MSRVTVPAVEVNKLLGVIFEEFSAQKGIVLELADVEYAFIAAKAGTPGVMAVQVTNKAVVTEDRMIRVYLDFHKKNNVELAPFRLEVLQETDGTSKDAAYVSYGGVPRADFPWLSRFTRPPASEDIVETEVIVDDFDTFLATPEDGADIWPLGWGVTAEQAGYEAVNWDIVEGGSTQGGLVCLGEGKVFAKIFGGDTARTGNTTRWYNDESYADVEALATVQVKGVSSGKLGGGIVLRAAGDGLGTDTDGYLFAITEGQDEFTIEKVTTDGGTTRVTVDTETESTITIVSTKRYNLRFQAKGTVLRAKVWEYGTPEPTAWLLRGTSSDYVSGKVGIWAGYGTTSFSNFALKPLADE